MVQTMVISRLSPPWRFNGAAGVGPRMEFWRRSAKAAEQRLQWGRGGWPADGERSSASIWRKAKLQWGRGGWPADGLDPRGGQVSAREASMGPRGLARGWLRRSNSARCFDASFNGAAGVGPRMGNTHGILIYTPPCFNGAAGVGPRMVCLIRQAPRRRTASMGPRGLARGW